MRVKWISPIPLLILLNGFVLNILIIKQRKSVTLLLSDLQHSGIEHWCTRQGKKIRNNVKIRLDLAKERHALLVEANNLVKGNHDVKFCLVDINCCLKIKWEDLRADSFFSLLEDLKGKLQVN